MWRSASRALDGRSLAAVGERRGVGGVKKFVHVGAPGGRQIYSCPCMWGSV